MKGFPWRLRIAVIGGVGFAIACSAAFASACKATPPAHAHGTFPALGFMLGKTRVADVEGWARDHGVECATKPRYVECGRVPASMLGESAMLGVTGVWFRFDESGALSSLQTTRRDRDVSSIAGAFDRLSAELSERAGGLTATTPTAVELSRGKRAMVEHRSSDFRAVVRASIIGDTFVLTEDYTRSD